MNKSSHPILLPTATFNSWSVTSLRDSLIEELEKDSTTDKLQMFFYAITNSGWLEIQKAVLQWTQRKVGRRVIIFAGTDHAITDPIALEKIQNQGIDVRLMNSYSGVFHPKVIWMSGNNKNLVWIGSNNLTRDGLLNNIEFAALIKSPESSPELESWVESVISGSIVLNKDLLTSYKNERIKFEKKIAETKAEPFTWSRKSEPRQTQTGPISTINHGDLIVEIMPEETRGGNQIQLPIMAARSFFGLKKAGDQIKIELHQKKSKEAHNLLVTVFPNNTVRLSVNELESGDRPCVIIFRKKAGHKVVFEIVSKNIFPTRYRSLIKLCTNQTRIGSRRWVII